MATPGSPPQSMPRNIHPTSADAAKAPIVDLEPEEYSELHGMHIVSPKTGGTDNDERPPTANSAYSGANAEEFETSGEAHMLRSLTHIPSALDQSEDLDAGTGTQGLFDRYRPLAAHDPTKLFAYPIARQPKMDLVGSHRRKRPAAMPSGSETTTCDTVQDPPQCLPKGEKRKAYDDHGHPHREAVPASAVKDLEAAYRPMERLGDDVMATAITQILPAIDAEQGSADAVHANTGQTDVHQSIEPVGPPRKKRKKRKKLLLAPAVPEGHQDQHPLPLHSEQPMFIISEAEIQANQGKQEAANEAHRSIQLPRPNDIEAALPEKHGLAIVSGGRNMDEQHQLHDSPTVTATGHARPATVPAPGLTDGAIVRWSGSGVEEGQHQLPRGHGLTSHVFSILEQYDAQHAAAVSELAKARDHLVNENERVNEAAQHLRGELDAVIQEKAVLMGLVEQHRQKLKTYVAKMSRFKTFVDGLGHDVDALKKESNVTKRRGDELAREGDDCKAQNAALYDKLSACTEKSVRLKDEALNLCRQAIEERLKACERNEWLERRVDELSGLLVEERDRRTEVERRLDEAHNTTLVRAIQSSHDTLIEKLYEIQEAAGTESKIFTTVSEMIASILAAVQALTSQHSSNADDICSVQASLKTIREAITTVAQAERNLPPTSIGTDRFQSLIETAMQALRSDIQRLDQHVRDSAETKVLSVLQGQLDASNAKCSHLEQQVEALNREKLGNNGHAQPVHDQINSPLNMRELQAKLDATVQDLNAAQATLTSKDDNHSALREEMRELGAQLTATESQRLKLEGALREEGDKARKHYKAHSEQLIAEYAAKKDNELHAAMQEKYKLQQMVGILKNELLTCKGQISGLEGQIEGLGRSETAELSLAKQVEDLTLKLSTERTKHQQRQAELDNAVHTAESAHATVKAELTATLEKLERNETGIEYLQQDCKRQVDAEEERGRRRVEALQQRLEEAEAELQASKDGQSHFATEFQESWDTETAQHAKQLSAAKANTTRIETERDEARAEHARLKKELEHLAAESDDFAAAQAAAVKAETARDEATAEIMRLRQELSALAAARSTPQPSSDRPLNIAMPRTSVSIVAEAMPSFSPLTSNKENESPRPRKKTDCTKQHVVDEGPIPVPKVLRPSSQAKTSESNTREPVTEDSQQPDPADVPLIEQQSRASLPVSYMRSMRADSEDMLDTVSYIYPQSTQIVEETRVNDLPTLAAFNAGGRTAHQSSVLSMPHSSQQSFAIHEDTRSQGSDTQAQAHKLEVTEADKEKFTFRKTFPHPNSASKLKPRPPTQRSADSSSSSPAFVKESVHSRKVSTYQGGEYSAKKRTLSRTGSCKPAADHYLLGRESHVAAAPSKRKGDQICESYKHEGKKRQVGSQESSQSDMESQARRYSLRGSGAPPSIRDLPSMTSTSSGRHGHIRSSAPRRSQLHNSNGPSGRAGKSMSKSKLLEAV